MAERKQVASMVSPEAHRELAAQAEASGQTKSRTAAGILERATSAKTAHDQCQARLAELSAQAKATSARVKAAKRAWAQDTNESTTAALDASKRELELLGERQLILSESLAEIRAELDAAQAEANAVQIDQLKAEADQIWAHMSETVSKAAAAVVSARSEFLKFEDMRRHLAENNRQREALGAPHDTDHEYQYLDATWHRACGQAFMASSTDGFPMSEIDARQAALLLFNRTPYNQR